MERLQKVIARAGLASRRAAERLVTEGRVTVNGAVAHLGQKVEPARDEILVDGRPLPTRSDLVYYLVNKPRFAVSTSRDTHGRPTVIDLVPSTPRVVPVGRLDADTVGLIILTNDGDLTLRLTHPRYGVTKTYVALVDGLVDDAAIGRLASGVDLEDGPARAVDARVVQQDERRTTVEIVMSEGRKREVRRMLEAVGYPVQALRRTQIGPIHDASLEPGQWRHLTDAEVAALYAAGTDPGDADHAD